MDKLGPPLRTGRGVQRFYDTDTKTDITIKRPNELLPIKNSSYLFFSGLMVKLGMTLLTAYPQSMEEVQKTVKEIHLYSYLNFAMNVEQGIQWNGQSSAVSVEFEEWLCECV
ncbi:hypothetical protein ASZ78_010750 [Callipepla squamata]|uniref:Uncharacterized protein n=1 Tax=Callipepla squamata TaxID=9009 RepID=A0A226N1Z6_CALSU|nr:hypothetical protein ASZ78_010750 [Callipepla squamata]